MVEKRGEKSNVGVITLNRPKALNALSDALMTEVGEALENLEMSTKLAASVTCTMQGHLVPAICTQREAPGRGWMMHH